MKQAELNGIRYFFRGGTSDEKAFNEVIGNRVYLRKGMKIEKGETWVDAGGNVGAFTLLACSLGANVRVYEPDPNNCKMIEKNLQLNGYSAEVICAGLVHNNVKKANLYVGNNNQVWRNSMFKNWNGKGIKVDCRNFDEETKDGECIKIDIEGAEMPILETTNRTFSKMVFEWSFDIDPSLPRFWNIVERLEEKYITKFPIKRTRYLLRDYDVWQKNWFPACENVYCYAKG